MVHASTLEIVGTALFATAVFHTFMVKLFHKLARKYPAGSVGENFFHLLSEIEVVFGFWAGVFLLFMASTLGTEAAISYLNQTHFTEPAFVFVIMCMAATKPITYPAEKAIGLISQLLPLNRATAYFIVALIVGPLLGSFITEPAAMTVTALILYQTFFSKHVSPRFKYFTIATLFVNVSIGGTLTHFAAPPVLMVAGKWGWDIGYMFSHFGIKSAVAVLINTAIAAYVLRHELKNLKVEMKDQSNRRPPPTWLMAIHILFVAGVVMASHHIAVFLGFFLYFLGIVAITKEYQSPLKLRDSLLVGFFLGGLVLFGAQQKWWLDVVLHSLSEGTLFLGATALTSITDNAALTYLGSQVEGISESFKYALVAGAVAGGGLTIIANAPNPAGYTILKNSFGATGLDPIRLLLNAALPTLVAVLCLWFIPSF